ncbi:hypothetical protein THAOC_32607 [Thalassiosira oceanica]|uniref:Uncharacterized protein n=1 Tax=Thalassiosira oceanica TaxID=159749 RepID=K0R5M8_THAOC|nr:hypothetical protein THAOC_32607 [Thalassiosira oceanica]|eukprot:EJK48583.1 hypothetical protein THAOC_32607 [Thalassiosira oceanica]
MLRRRPSPLSRLDQQSVLGDPWSRSPVPAIRDATYGHSGRGHPAAVLGVPHSLLEEACNGLLLDGGDVPTLAAAARRVARALQLHWSTEHRIPRAVGGRAFDIEPRRLGEERGDAGTGLRVDGLAELSGRRPQGVPDDHIRILVPGERNIRVTSDYQERYLPLDPHLFLVPGERVRDLRGVELPRHRESGGGAH